MADSYRPRLLLIIVCALIIAQIFVITSLKQEVSEQMLAAQQAINTQTLLQSALVKILDEKGVITRQDLLREASAISQQVMQTDPAAEPPFDTSGLAPPVLNPTDR
jgi:hypothetical protein